MNKLILATIFLSITSFDAFAKDKILLLKSDLWCPYACDEKAVNKGIVVDMVTMILEKKGYKIKYSNVNYARALKENREGEIDGVVGCAKEDAPDFIFPKTHQLEASYHYFKKKGGKFKFENLDSVKNMKIGVINSYTYDSTTTDLVSKKHPSYVVVSGDLGLGQLLKMVDNNNIDAFVENDFVLSNFLTDGKIDRNKYQLAGTPKQVSQKITVGFSPKKGESKKLAELIDSGMKELKKSGELNKIISKYNLTKWE
jgi:polar amino acid transport system substrate-binding protein